MNLASQYMPPLTLMVRLLIGQRGWLEARHLSRQPSSVRENYLLSYMYGGYKGRECRMLFAAGAINNTYDLQLTLASCPKALFQRLRWNWSVTRSISECDSDSSSTLGSDEAEATSYEEILVVMRRKQAQLVRKMETRVHELIEAYKRRYPQAVPVGKEKCYLPRKRAKIASLEKLRAGVTAVEDKKDDVMLRALRAVLRDDGAQFRSPQQEEAVRLAASTLA
ncbi:Uncharacterized protein HZ326_26102 [Fusarium oxysporum f. sp. albedinis]|nr:Uncharacterized protein HZ326_26102 [Fusarium oxysporum f. sp. albedinis]